MHSRFQRFAATAILAAVFVLPSFAASLSRAADTRPNILFIFTDDHAAHAISAYGSKINKTPNIDRIANEGMRFNHCLVTNSICGPSRACILTGKYSHKNGFFRNGNRFDGLQQNFAKILSGGGYQTAMIGKWHLSSDPTGFDHWEVLQGQGPYYNPPMKTADGYQSPHGLHDRNHHRPGARMAGDGPRRVEALHADVSTQGAASQLAAGARVSDDVRRRHDHRAQHAL